MTKAFLLIGKSRKTKETKGLVLYTLFDPSRGLTLTVDQVEYNTMLASNVVFDESDNFVPISETRLNENFERIEGGKTLIYHIHDIVEHNSKERVGFLLAFVNKTSCYTQSFKSGELYSFLVSGVDKKSILATPSNASLMMNHSSTDKKKGYPVARFKAIKGSLRKVLV